MQLVKAWALAVCMACAAAGLLQQLVPAKGKTSVIKLVLTLYILVTAFTPLAALRYPETRLTVPVLPENSTLTAPDTRVLVMDEAERTLAETVRAACEARGLSVQNVQVELAEAEDKNAGAAIVIKSVRIISAADEAQLQAAAADALGEAAPVEVVR